MRIVHVVSGRECEIGRNLPTETSGHAHSKVFREHKRTVRPDRHSEELSLRSDLDLSLSTTDHAKRPIPRNCRDARQRHTLRGHVHSRKLQYSEYQVSGHELYVVPKRQTDEVGI